MMRSLFSKVKDVVLAALPSILGGGIFGAMTYYVIFGAMRCQDNRPFACFPVSEAQSAANAVSSLVVGGLILYFVLLLLFYILGTMSQMLTRLAGAMLDRIFLVFGLILVWFVTFYQLADVIIGSDCAMLDVETLATGVKGPPLLRLLFWGVHIFGLI